MAQEQAQTRMHERDRYALETAELMNPTRETGGTFKFGHPVGVDQGFDLHRPDIRKYR